MLKRSKYLDTQWQIHRKFRTTPFSRLHFNSRSDKTSRTTHAIMKNRLHKFATTPVDIVSNHYWNTNKLQSLYHVEMGYETQEMPEDVSEHLRTSTSREQNDHSQIPDSTLRLSLIVYDKGNVDKCAIMWNTGWFSVNCVAYLGGIHGQIVNLTKPR